MDLFFWEATGLSSNWEKSWGKREQVDLREKVLPLGHPCCLSLAQHTGV